MRGEIKYKKAYTRDVVTWGPESSLLCVKWYIKVKRSNSSQVFLAARRELCAVSESEGTHQTVKEHKRKKQCKISMLTTLSWEELTSRNYVWETRCKQTHISVSSKFTLFFITVLTETKTLKYYRFGPWHCHLNVRKKPLPFLLQSLRLIWCFL